MKSTSKAQSATSLPEAPRDDEHRRSSRYLIMMGIRVLCFILMVVVTPYSWYTWVFAAGAILIPYVAVVLANAGSDVSRSLTAENPERALPAAPSMRPAPAASAPTVLRIEETRTIAPRRGDADASA